MIFLVPLTIFTTIFTINSDPFRMMARQGIEEPCHHPRRGMNGGKPFSVAFIKIHDGDFSLWYEFYIDS